MKKQNTNIITVLIALTLLLSNNSFAKSLDSQFDTKDTKVVKVLAPVVKILSETLIIDHEGLALLKERLGDFTTITLSFNDEFTLIVEDDSPDYYCAECQAANQFEDWMFEDLSQANEYDAIEDWMLDNNYYDSDVLIEDWMLDTGYWDNKH